MKKFSRVTADIDLDAVRNNLEVMHARLRPGTQICAVIKANGYGHGALQLAREIQPYPYVWGYACATCGEAMALRAGGITKPIMLLGYAFPESYEDMVDYDIRACIFDTKSAELLGKTAGSVGQTALCHIALDTGMGRIGFPCTDEAVREIAEISKVPNLRIEGMFTHFARADEKSMAPIDVQLEKYLTMSRKVAEAGISIPIHHVSNSAALMRRKDANFDMVRAGITLYGLMPSNEVKDEMDGLKPVLSLKSHISFVKTLPAGAAVSYGGTYVTEKDTRIATIPVGYADGWPRSLSGRGQILIHGKRVPIVGRICMDQFMADVSGVPDAAVGDEVVLIGRQGDEEITAEEVGDVSGRFNYELVCDISDRVPRNYLRRGMIMEQVDYFY